MHHFTLHLFLCARGASQLGVHSGKFSGPFRPEQQSNFPPYGADHHTRRNQHYRIQSYCRRRWNSRPEECYAHQSRSCSPACFFQAAALQGRQDCNRRSDIGSNMNSPIEIIGITNRISTCHVDTALQNVSLSKAHIRSNFRPRMNHRQERYSPLLESSECRNHVFP